MKTLRKYSIILVIIFSLTVISSGCGPTEKAQSTESTPKASVVEPTKAKSPVTIKFVNWATIEEGTRDKINGVIANFEKENPDIKIDAVGIPVSDIGGQITIMSSSGNAPDVAMEQLADVFLHAEAGFLEPIAGLISKELLALIPPNVLNNTLLGGKHYGVPWNAGDVGFWYNKKLMKEAGLDPANPPKTIEELDAAIVQARTKLPKDVIMLQLDTTIRTIGVYHLWPFMMAFNNGVRPFSEDGKVNFNTPGMKKFSEWIRKHVAEGNTLPGKKFGEFRPYAAKNKLLFGFDGAYLLGTMQALNKELTAQEIYDTWGVAPIPGIAGGKNYTISGGHVLDVFKDSKYKRESMKFIEYLVGSEYSIKNYILPIGFPPVLSNTADKYPEVANNPIMKVFIKDVLPTGVQLPYGAKYPKACEIVMTSVQEMITTKNSLDDILTKAQQKIEELYKK